MRLENHTSVTFEEHLACTQISFEWACSYDTKDWARLEKILLPELHINYTAVMGPGKEWPRMPAQDFVAMMSSKYQLGNPLVATQHLLGASSWKRTSEYDIVGTYQIRAAHIRYEADATGNRSQTPLTMANGHGIITYFYRKDTHGAWKLAGLQPTVYFDEGSVPAVFH